MADFLNLTKNTPISREEFAYASIKEAILGGDLLPNQKISLSNLSRSLGVSIIPVNQAVRRLVAEGLVRQKSHHSPYVEGFSADELGEILTIRYHLEELALREAIPFIGEEEMKILRVMKEEMDNTVRDHDMHAYGIANRKFHMQIYSYNPFSMLYDSIDDFWNKAELHRSRSVFSLVQNMAEHSQEDHALLLDLVEQKKIEEAINALKEHREYSRGKLLESIK